MKNLKVSKKLIIAFGAVIVILVIITNVAGLGVSSFTGKLEIINSDFNGTNLVNSLEISMEQVARYTLSAGVADDEAQRTAYINKITEANNGLIQTIDQVGSMKGSEGLQPLLDSCRKVADGIPAVVEKLRSGDTTGAIGLYNTSVSVSLDECSAIIDEVFAQINEEAARNYESSKRSSVDIMAKVYLIGVVGEAICIFFAIYLTRNFTGAIRQIKDTIVDISNGKLDTDVKYQSRDEFGQMSEAMRVTSERLSAIIRDTSRMYSELANGNFDVHTEAREMYVGEFQPLLDNMRVLSVELSSTMSQIYRAADQVNSGSEQVSAGAQANAQGATEQAGSVQELAATIDEISGKISRNAEDSDGASREIAQVGRDAEDSNRRMTEMLDAMKEISDTSSQISDIIKTIEEIAFQTNILALNAAVEAARAGEAGKGFAVVADEVRNLASKSADASQSTGDLIRRAIGAVENGSRIADETAGSLSGVVKRIEDIIVTINRISSVSGEQAEAISQIRTGIEQISNVVQTNSATAEQSAAASEELTAQADAMKTLVSRFNLRKEEN